MLGTAKAALLVPAALLFTAVMGSISLFCSLFDGSGRLQHACARFWARALIRLSGVEVQAYGLENIEPGRTYIFAANHQSYFDIWALLATLPVEFRFVAKKSLFKWPFLGWHLRRSGNIPIDRGDTRRALKTMLAAAEKIRAGTSIVAFPEGTRSANGAVAPFKKGVFFLALRAGVAVVPISISGSRQCLPKGSLLVRPGRIDVVIGKPIELGGYGQQDSERLAEAARAAVIGNLKGGRG